MLGDCAARGVRGGRRSRGDLLGHRRRRRARGIVWVRNPQSSQRLGETNVSTHCERRRIRGSGPPALSEEVDGSSRAGGAKTWQNERGEGMYKTVKALLCSNLTEEYYPRRRQWGCNGSSGELCLDAVSRRLAAKCFVSSEIDGRPSRIS